MPASPWLVVERLALSLEGASGHEHRAAAVAARAAELLAADVPADLLVRSGELGTLEVGPVEVDLRLTGDEELARRIAAAVHDALRVRLGA